MNTEINKEQLLKDVQMVVDAKLQLEKLTELLQSSHEAPLTLSFYSLMDKSIQGFAGEHEDIVKMFVFDSGNCEEGCAVGYKNGDLIRVKTTADLVDFIMSTGS